LQAEANVGFPEKVTAFRKEMAVHGRFAQPNYCARCQTDGKILADRALSRLLGAACREAYAWRRHDRVAR
jgi:formamidopyrimidine-DNA glycosylase